MKNIVIQTDKQTDRTKDIIAVLKELCYKVFLFSRSSTQGNKVKTLCGTSIFPFEIKLRFCQTCNKVHIDKKHKGLQSFKSFHQYEYEKWTNRHSHKTCALRLIINIIFIVVHVQLVECVESILLEV